MICSNCKSKFSIPDEIREDKGEHFGIPCYEVIPICPYCHSDEIEDGVECGCCKENFVCSDMYNFDICHDCFDDLCDKVKNFLNNYDPIIYDTVCNIVYKIATDLTTSDNDSGLKE